MNNTRITTMESWRSLWRMFRAGFIAFGVLLCFFTFIELIRAFEVLYSLHPIVGFLFLAVLIGICAYGTLHFLRVYRTYPPVLIPPVKEGVPLTLDEAKKHATYIVRLMRRLATNGNLGIDTRRRLEDSLRTLSNLTTVTTDKDRLNTVTEQLEREMIESAIGRLDEIALKAIRNCVRDVMIGVTLSPWRSADLFVVIYRNSGMLLQIMQIYNARARIAEQWAILRDVLAIVATVNILNYGSKLFLNLASGLPFLGRYADDIAQGVGAGLLTSVAGRTALDRCRAYRGWSRIDEQQSIRSNLKAFLEDIKGIFAEDVLVHLRRPVEAECPEERSKPDFMDRLRQGIFKAVDQTASMIDLLRPMPAEGPPSPPLEPFGKSVWNKATKVTVKAAGATGRGAKVAGKAIGHGTLVAGITVGRGATHAGRSGGQWVRGMMRKMRKKKTGGK